MPAQREPILVSACLLGLLSRYDGRTKRNQAAIDFIAAHRLIPVPICPEQLAGLPTPREATRFQSGEGGDVLAGTGQVVSISGQPMNAIFCHGARETLRIARLAGCRLALLKERSPSCGVLQIDRNGQTVAGSGVTAALLRQSGVRVFSEEELGSIRL